MSNDSVYNDKMLTLVASFDLYDTYQYTYDNPINIDKIFDWLFSENFHIYTNLQLKYKITRARYSGIYKGCGLFKGTGFKNCIELNLVHQDDSASTKIRVFNTSLQINISRKEQIGEIVQFLLDMLKYPNDKTEEIFVD